MKTTLEPKSQIIFFSIESWIHAWIVYNVFFFKSHPSPWMIINELRYQNWVEKSKLLKLEKYRGSEVHLGAKIDV